MRTFATIVAAALVLSTGCSQTDSPPAESADPAPSAAAPAAPQTYEFGQPATVIGEGGGRITVTPTGVLYHRGPYKGLDGPLNGWYVAVAITAQPETGQETFLAPASGGGWRWRAGGESLWGGEGNSAPWEGAAPAFGDPMPPGQPTVSIETFDVSAKGGELVYINPDDTTVVWQVPARDTGDGLEKVRRQIRRFS